LKTLLFLLLVGNTAWFIAAGETSKALDSAAWLALLALFMLETGHAERFESGRAQAVLRVLRLAAAIGVIAAMLRYVLEDNVLDAVNSALWIAVVVLLEAELRYPEAVRRARGVYLATAAALYSALAVMVVWWALRSEWFDAYDATAWLAAFVLVELDILKPRGARA
jgi:hypothetical protein